MSDRTYPEALHAMQTGVATKADLGIGKEVDPKHLRTGLNAAMSDHGALVGLLVARGVFTEAEYFEAIRLQMNKEADGYQAELSGYLGKPVTLK